MDEEYRQDAKQKIQVATNFGTNKATEKSVLTAYSQAISSFLKIDKKTFEDYRVLSKTYYDVATIFFNTKEFAKAAQAYLDSIAELQHTELNDNTYRTITERYIDLADACYELSQQQAGNEAMTNALKAFSMIKIKNPQELEIGDPIANFKQFHDYFEQQLSTSSYTKSTQLINHSMLLAEQQQERALLAQLDGISIGEIKKIDDSIETMLSLLTVAAPPAQSTFSPVVLAHAPNDNECRKLAMDVLRLTQIHFRNGLVVNAIKTYEQVIGILRSLKATTESDGKIIQELKAQITFLRTKPAQTAPSASAAAFFVPATTARIDNDENETMDDMDEPEAGRPSPSSVNKSV